MSRFGHRRAGLRPGGPARPLGRALIEQRAIEPLLYPVQMGSERRPNLYLISWSHLPGRAWKGVTSPGLPRIARTAAVSAARRRLLAADERGVIAGSSQMTVQRGASATVVAWPDQAGVTSTGESCRVGQKARLPWLWAISTRLVGTRRGGLGISGTYPASPFTKRRGRAPRRCRRRSMRRWVTPIAGATDVRCSKTTP